MTVYEYRVVPAPSRGLKAKGVKGAQARFAHAVQTVMNTQAAEGWEYQRTDTMPMEERQGLTGRSTSFQTMLVFRRAVELGDEAGMGESAPLGLIEDQSDVSEEAEDLDDAAPDEVAPEHDETSHDETLQDETLAAQEAEDQPDLEDAPEGDGALDEEVQQRVEETLNAPGNSPGFAFLRRRKAQAREAEAAAPPAE